MGLTPTLASLVLLTSSCAAPDEAPPPRPSVSTTTATTSATASCLLDSRPSTAQIIRHAAAPGSTWWITYTVLVNPCATDARITGLSFLGLQPGSDVTWSGTSGVRVLPEGEVPFALRPGASLTPTKLAGYVLKPNTSVEVMALVTKGAERTMPHRVPVLDLAFEESAGPDELRLAPDTRLCTCNPLG